MGLILGATVAAAGSRDEHFDSRALISLPTLSELRDATALVVEGPKFDLSALRDLLGIRPVDTSIEMSPVPTLSRDESLLSPELHAEFAEFVQAFATDQARRSGLLARIEAAAAALHAGRPAEAISVLLAIEAASPGAYETAATLSKACEFAGRLDEAILWLARAIERRPPSRDDSDWLQIAILRTRVKLQASPEWLDAHSVLDEVAERAPDEIVRAIEQQLEERRGFAGPPDAVMCDLFFQAAIRLTGADASEKRMAYFRESLRFGGWRKAAIAAWARS